MPITDFATNGVLSDKQQSPMVAELAGSLLRRHDLTGNAFLTPHVIGEVNVIPKEKTFSAASRTTSLSSN